jgi:aspartyl-tRNA(Asn)/glutamyl-tRNA(Gln) amidotransferase subunit A
MMTVYRPFRGETRALARRELVDRRSFLTSSGVALGATAFSRLSPSEGAMHDLTAAEIARRVRAGTLSPIEVVEACLKRIDEVDPSVLAWVHVDRNGALQSARELEAEARAGKFRGPLHGVSVGIKDIIAVSGMVTTNGSGEFAHERPEADATCVAKLRGAGAIILGKTATTQFASGDPAPTRNPWNLEHTPGGSSSGSAAGVASGMMPLALGTQTGGSVLRPAAYCGIVGLKPTHGRISTAGVTPLAWSLDHVGVFARSVPDAALALGVLAGHDDADLLSATAATTDYIAALHDGERPPRLGIPRQLYQDKASAEVSGHLDAVASAFAREGAAIEEVLLPDSAEKVQDAHAVVMRVEAAAHHRERFADHADSYRPFIHAIVEEGLSIPGFEYARARKLQREFRRDMTRALEGLDALLMPVAPTPAPNGLESTGDPRLCVPGSFSGLPAIAIPSGLSADGLPLAVQLISGSFAEDRLLATASWCEAALAFHDRPRISSAG